MEIDSIIFPEKVSPTWAQPIFSILKEEILPDDEVMTRQIVRSAKSYTIINSEIYKRSVTNVLQQCVDSAEGKKILLNIHQGECGHHASSRALLAKAFRLGFYWPTTLMEAKELVSRCNCCQKYARKIHLPSSELKTIPITWPFSVWCLDMVGHSSLLAAE